MNLQFKEIKAESLKEMLPFYAMRKNQTCDSVFMESFIWKEFYHVKYAIWEGKALLWLMEYGGRCFSAMPLCKEEDLFDAFKAIEAYFNEELGYPLVINLADEYAVQYLNLPEHEYVVEEQIDSRDYLYLGEAMRTLSGKKLHKKKNRVNAFMREYEGRYEYRALCCSDSGYVWEFLDDWRKQKGKDVEEHLDYEVKGIHDILKNCSALNVKMGGVFVDGELEAFTIGSYNPVEDMAVIHIEKANPKMNGLYQYINRQFLIEEFPEVTWVNREDDLGLEGLRKAKMSYYPADFARKYLVEQIVDGKRGYHWAEEIGNTIAGEELQYLEHDDKLETRRLWNECFPEDSELFLDYYYTEKTKDNKLLIEKHNGLIASMAHWNPYQMKAGNKVWNTGYIAGVATEKSRRHQGHMSRILKKLLTDMQNVGNPFTFLMPASEEIYLPFQFVTVYHEKSWKISPEWKERITSVLCNNVPEDCKKAASWMQEWLEGQYEVFCTRDEDYVSRLIRELESEDGALEFLYDGESMAGLRATWGSKKKEERLLYLKKKYVEETEDKKDHAASIMIRVTSIQQFLSMFVLKPGEEALDLFLEVQDPILEENTGIYHWVMDQNGSRAEKYQEDVKEDNISTGVEQLVQWLFDCRKPEELWPSLSEELLKKVSSVKVLKEIWIDEVV